MRVPSKPKLSERARHLFAAIDEHDHTAQVRDVKDTVLYNGKSSSLNLVFRMVQKTKFRHHRS